MNINQIMFLLLLAIGIIIFLFLLADSKQGHWTMKTFILLILMVDNSGNEYIDRVNNIKYNDELSCLVDKAIMSNDSVIANDDTTTKSITYFCYDDVLYTIK